MKQALYTQSGCHELFQVLQQVIAYLRRQVGLASRTCLSWDYQFYCSRLCRRECVGSKFFSLLLLPPPFPRLLSLLRKGNALSRFCAPLVPLSAQSSYPFSLPSKEDRSRTFDYLSFIPISNRNGENSGTEGTALPQLFSMREFLLFRSTFARITFYSVKYATSRIDARGCLTGTLARRVNKGKGREEISVVSCPPDNMLHYNIIRHI